MYSHQTKPNFTFSKTLATVASLALSGLALLGWLIVVACATGLFDISTLVAGF